MKIEPYSDGVHEWFLASDEGSPRRADFVVGAGGASATLASLIPRIPFESALDLGCGGGIQSLHLSTHVSKIVATDLNPRALELAAETARCSGVEFDLRLGSLYEPVVGECFDLIVSNPPFVISPKARFSYRDGGMTGDDVSRLLVSGAANHLTDDGWFVALTNWIHKDGQDWRERVVSWLAENEGCDGWAVQREVLGVEDYVDLWAKDSGDESNLQADQERLEWLSYFKDEGINSIGFGWVVLHKSGRLWPWRRLEEVRHPIDSPLGEWVTRRFADFDLVQDLDDSGILNLHLALAPGVEILAGTIRQLHGWRRAGAIDHLGAEIAGSADGSEPIGVVARRLAPGLADLDLVEPIKALVAEGFFVYPTDLQR
ncbi:MAG TPA: methyltransferase [Candidatus Nanopelagicaceae bacterium]|nr:methyltransferase [Candidatus Nanopelagicaceae bacterium]